MKIHFISGLSRSGTTLLGGILRQNPRFVAGLTSPVSRIFQAIEYSTSQDNDFACLLNDEQKIALRRSVFTSVYPDDGRVVFDKGHFWTGKMGILSLLFPEAKVVAMVRHLSWVMDSWERIYQSNPIEMSRFFNFKTDTSVYTRCARLGASEGAVGRPFDGVREAYYGPYKDRLLLVEYTALATKPQETMRDIYQFIDEPFYQHDFRNVELSFDEYDRKMGVPGLHTIRREVKFIPRKTILPPDLFDRYRDDHFWSLKRHRAPALEEAA